MRTIGQLIDDILSAIIRQEGMNPNYANPGNLRNAPWLAKPIVINGFWRPASRRWGTAGAAHVIALHIAEGNTLRNLISIWAPATDGNNTSTYLANVQTWARISDVDEPLINLVQV